MQQVTTGFENTGRVAGVLGRLRAETRDLHDVVEQRPLMASLMSDSLTPPTYAACLVQLEQFHTALEPTVETMLGARGELQLPLRRKTVAVRRDLAHLGCSAAKPPPPFVLDTEAEAWGALYVVEGSTLGGVIITRHLSRHYWLGQSAGRSYFAGYGASTGMMWTRFRMALTDVADDSAHFADLAVAAARRTFQLLDVYLAAEHVEVSTDR